MNDPLHREYLELLRGAREYLLFSYDRGAQVLADKENWEALRKVMMAAPKQTSQQPPTQKFTKPLLAQSPPPLLSQTPSSLPHEPFRPTVPAPIKPAAPRVAPSRTVTPPEGKKDIEEKITRALNLTERPSPPTIDFSDWKQIFQEKFTHIPLQNPIPPGKPPLSTFTIVYDTVSDRELIFLQNIARTCHILLGPTRLVPNGQYVPSPHIVTAGYGVTLENGLAIEPLSVYLQSPKLKALLWRQLYSHFMQKSS